MNKSKLNEEKLIKTLVSIKIRNIKNSVMNSNMYIMIFERFRGPQISVLSFLHRR